MSIFDGIIFDNKATEWTDNMEANITKAELAKENFIERVYDRRYEVIAWLKAYLGIRINPEDYVTGIKAENIETFTKSSVIPVEDSMVIISFKY